LTKKKLRKKKLSRRSNRQFIQAQPYVHNMGILEEYVQFVIEERKRPFRLEHLKSLTSVKDVVAYANNTLKKFDAGSSRKAYILNTRYVLKVAYNKKGIAQNEAEIDIFTNPATKQLTTKIANYSDDYSWLIAELVRPMDRGAEDVFESRFGTSLYSITLIVKGLMGGGKKEDYTEYCNEECFSFAESLISLLKTTELVIDDLSREEQWGQTPDGRIVILDYGYTTTTKQLYHPSPAGSNVATKNY